MRDPPISINICINITPIIFELFEALISNVIF